MHGTLLQDELGNERIPEEEVPHMVELFDECLTFCLDQGGAYTEEFLQFRPYTGADSLMRLAGKLRRFDLLKRIVKKLDEKYPDDEEAKLYRHFAVVRETESLEAARRVAERLCRQFPDGKYHKRAERELFWLERGQAEQESSDDGE